MTEDHEIERLETDGVPIYNTANSGNGFHIDGWITDRENTIARDEDAVTSRTRLNTYCRWRQKHPYRDCAARATKLHNGVTPYCEEHYEDALAQEASGPRHEMFRALHLATFDNYQRRAEVTAIQPEAGVPALLFWTLGLCGEAGELAEKVKKIYRDNAGVMTAQRLDAIVAEMGDVLWYMAAVSTVLGVKLGDVASFNIGKLEDRYKRNAIQGEGDKR